MFLSSLPCPILFAEVSSVHCFSTWKLAIHPPFCFRSCVSREFVCADQSAVVSRLWGRPTLERDALPLQSVIATISTCTLDQSAVVESDWLAPAALLRLRSSARD